MSQEPAAISTARALLEVPLGPLGPSEVQPPEQTQASDEADQSDLAQIAAQRLGWFTTWLRETPDAERLLAERVTVFVERDAVLEAAEHAADDDQEFMRAAGLRLVVDVTGVNTVLGSAEDRRRFVELTEQAGRFVGAALDD